MIPILAYANTLKLTDTEREILDYFEKNCSRVTGLGLKELSALLYTSDATIVRFCQKLGLHGYNDLKYRIRQELRQKYRDLQEGYDLLERSVAQFQDNLELLNMKLLLQAAEYLAGNSSIYIYGQNLSSLPARYLHQALTNMDHPSILIDWRELALQLSKTIDEKSVFFIVSAKSEPEPFQTIIRNASERGAVTILLTCDRATALKEECSICLFANDENQEFMQMDLNTRFGMFTVIEILIEMISERTLQV